MLVRGLTIRKTGKKKKGGGQFQKTKKSEWPKNIQKDFQPHYQAKKYQIK